MSKQFDVFSNRRLSVGLHVLAWLTIMLIPRYIVNTFGNGQMRFLHPLYVNMFVYGVLFYFNFAFLVPRFFFVDKKRTYILLSLLTLLVISTILWYLNERVFFDPVKAQKIQEIFDQVRDEKEMNGGPPVKELKVLSYIYTSILVSGFSLGLKLIQKVGLDEKKRKELEKEKLNSELAFLKNQISPHFFFNTLNNIYSLIGINTQDAQESVLKLSKMMRYLLYDSEKGLLPLSNEIDFLKHYIDLMKLRLSSKVKLRVQIPERHPNYKIPPLLFVSFVENAFKHGVSYREPSFIEITMEVKDDYIYFSTKNSIAHKNGTQKNTKHSGIGLENVKKRLNLLYPSSHKLNIETTPEYFKVDLTLQEIAS